MKTQLLTFRKTIYGLLFVSFLFTGCSKEEVDKIIENPDAESIEDYIRNLVYNQDELLGLVDTGGEASVTDELNSVADSVTVTGIKTKCTTKTYGLKTNFDDIAILKPNSGVIWPGALVKGNASMRNGVPEPFRIKRAPMTLRVENLSGIGEAGTINIDNPNNASVGEGIDEALEAWNVIADEKGYVNAASQSSKTKVSYSSKQLSLELGLNVDWASTEIASEFNYTSTSTKTVAVMSFKQVFYTIAMNSVLSPSDVFASDVSLEEVENAFNSSEPPAYVASVSYGRIIMFRLETTRKFTDAEVIASLKYAAGDNGLDTNLYSKYEEVLAESTITTLVLGGGASSGSEVASANNFGDLNSIIEGENAVYSRNNPGVPISYTIKYLKDDSIAKLGYSTEYSVATCVENSVSHKTVDFINDSAYDFRAGITYDSESPDTPSVGYNEITWKVNQKSGEIDYFYPPDGAYNIHLYIEEGSGGNYKDAKHAVLGDVLDKENTCWRATSDTKFFVPCCLKIDNVTCNY